jgi:hypothetical protein
MKIAKFFAVILTIVFFSAGLALAQDLVVYPAKGQSKEQMDKDKYECYNWAKQQSGFDPMQVPKASQPPPQQEPQKGGLGRGAARGAAVGAAVGSLDGEMGEGAKKGAIIGGAVGGIRRREQQRQQQAKQQEWEQQQAAEYTQKRSAYNRAYGACLEGRGYTVK